MIDPAKVACVVIAGGNGRRLGADVPKPLVEIGARPMLAHVLDRVLGRVGLVAVSANEEAAFARFALPVVRDRRPERLGPLAALEAAALHVAANHGAFTHLLSLPGDTPFLPGDVVAGLLSSGAGARPVVCAAFENRPQPTVALWPLAPLLDALPARLDSARDLSIRRFADPAAVSLVEFPSDAAAPGGDPFFNVNTPADLARARAAFDRR